MSEKSDPRGRPCEGSSTPEAGLSFPPGRLFCGCFSGFPELLFEIKPRLEAIWGQTCKQSRLLDFPETKFYERTMGHNLKRIFYVFSRLCPQDCLAEVKVRSGELEEEITRSRSWAVTRPINLDPGLLTECRVVLASTKERAHRLPRADGVYEEIALLYFDAAFRPLPWTYPDYRSSAYIEFFEEVRREYLAETRTVRKGFRAERGDRPR